MARRVLCLLAPAFEEIEAIAPIDLLRRAGAEVVMAALGEERRVTGRNGVTVALVACLYGDAVAKEIACSIMA